MSSPKVNYVLRQKQTRLHTCHWPGCDKQMPPALWSCREHWFKLPVGIRTRIWKAYRIGQEITADPSEEYVAAAVAAQEWIKNHA